MKSLKDCPIAIISTGCVLPKAHNMDEFWSCLMEAQTTVRPMPESRWSSELYMTNDRLNRDQTYTRFGGYIDDEFYDHLQKKWGNPLGVKVLMNLQLIEAAAQIFAPWPKGFLDRRIDTHIGCMHFEEAQIMTHFDNESQDIIRTLLEMHEPEAKQWMDQYTSFRAERIQPFRALGDQLLCLSSHIARIQKLFKFKGARSTVDAACASSLAAINLGVNKLLSGEADMALVGGFESFLTPPGFVSFTSVGAVAPEVCLPFDRRSQGLSLGEGCGLFLLQRLEDAVREEHPIIALIEGIGSSSDGNASSLFSPTVAGQKRAYAECYDGLDLNRLAYVECHGTGTTLGDAVELQSCGEFLGNKQVPIGSSKAIWGHTRGAAGAVGALKAIEVLRRKTVPPSPYFEEKVHGFPGNLHVNKESEKFPASDLPSLVGVSSFGFGGINYHMALGEWRRTPDVQVKCTTRPVSKEALVVAYDEVDMDYIKENADWAYFKIPKRSRPHVDLTHIAALHLVKNALDKARIPLNLIEKSKIVTISGASMALDNSKRFGAYVYYQGLPGVFKGMPKANLDKIMKLKDRYPAVTEDTGAGGLNNIIVGRVSNFFDFHGKTYSIDADGQSWAVALEAAIYELSAGAELAILIGFDIHYHEDVGAVLWKKGHATILTNQKVAETYGIKVESVLKMETIEGTESR